MGMRDEWITLITKLADPVLTIFVERRQDMPAQGDATRKHFMYLEALGRLLCGMAPWLELGGDDTEEGKLRQKYAEMAREAIDAATDPASPVYCNFTDELPSLKRPYAAQPIVDAAFLGQAFLRAPEALWGKLEPRVKSNVISAFKTVAKIRCFRSNWLLFSGMVETALDMMGGKADMMHVDYGLFAFTNWYKGDGIYGDGELFSFDYYNSFVIHPMLLDITAHMTGKYTDREEEMRAFQQKVVRHAKRYAAIQEKLINADGTFPAVGRSLTYRCGAFHLLAQAAYQHLLPDGLSPAQVRCALNAVIKKCLEAPGTFDGNGWLQLGLYGYQPGMAEVYISTGSLYLCSTAFLPLGLPAGDDFWSGADEKWTAQKIWSGEDFRADHSEN